MNYFKMTSVMKKIPLSNCITKLYLNKWMNNLPKVNTIMTKSFSHVNRLSFLKIRLPMLVYKYRNYSYDQQNYSWFRSPFLFFLSFTIPFFASDEKKNDPEDELITSMKYAILAFQRGDYAKAEQLLHVCLKSAQDTNNTKAVTYIYDLMGNFALQNGDFKKAQDIFVDVLKRFLQSGMSNDDNAVVDVSLKLASVHASLGEHEKADLAFNFCIGTQDKKLKEFGPENLDEDTMVLWAMSHDWFARYLLSLGQYTNAKSHFQKAYDVCLKVKGENDPQTAVLLNDLGSVSSLQENYDEAVDYLSKAITIGEKCESEDLASFYLNLGTVYIHKSLYNEAQRHCYKAQVISYRMKDEGALKESKQCLQTIKSLLSK